MIIRKIKYGFFAVLDQNGKEIAVASSFSEAYRILKKMAKKTNEAR